MTVKLIIALDFADQRKALDLIDQLNPAQCALKVGSEMFTLFGADFVKLLIKRQFKVFLDLKFHDIPNTVSKACKASADMGVWMLNVHAAGGLEMMAAARNALEPFGEDKPLLIAVTVLTSMSEEQLPLIGVPSALTSQVLRLAKLAFDTQLDGVVCSAQESSLIKESFGSSFVTVTPGIRLSEENSDDQSRIMTPKKAIAAGSDYLVIGRPVSLASHPADVVKRILQYIA